jgi:hypothetical protein
MRLDGQDRAVAVRHHRRAADTGAGVVGVDRGSLGLGLFLSTDRDIVGDAQLMVPGLLENLTPDFLSLSLGGKAQVALLTDPDDEVFALSPGAEARLALPFDTPMFVVGSIFYAPDISTSVMRIGSLTSICVTRSVSFGTPQASQAIA